MAYLGSFAIDDYVGIPAATHRFSSGAAYAPTTLTYSIYEEATAVGLDEDVDMTPASPFDSIVGCYWVRRQLTAAAGFEAGKNYLVVVKATVDSVSAIQMHTFQVLAKVTATTVSDKTGYTASTVSDKTGYSLAASQTFNVTGNLSGSVGSVTGAVGSVTAGVTLADGSLTTAKLGTFALAKTTNITGFNDIAATDVVSGGAINTSGGAVSIVTTVTNLTNAPTAGDFTSTMKTSLNAATPAVTVSDKTGFSLAASQTFNMTGNITGNLSGSVGSVTGAVGSVTGAVGSVSGITFPTNFGSLSITAAGLVATTSNVKKNQALAKFQFLMTDSTNHVPATGKTVTVTRSIDGGAFGAGSLSAVTELSNGVYGVDFAAADLNGNVIVLRATATACDDTFERIITQP